ncbi:MAG: coproporphyrinogen dehydrogenase HemZ [Clostridia bacterium]|nr:coproporphyrinogen dehydrogenase HemZ [Clostridia bacterium]
MILSINEKSFKLYLEHIVKEVFSERFADELLDAYVKIENGFASAEVKLLKEIVSSRERISEHPSESIAVTCALGKCIIKLGRLFGGNSLPYGVLTGVRPLKLAKDICVHSGIESVIEGLEAKYLVRADKGELLSSCVKYDGVVNSLHKIKDVSLYVSIPFCPSRCSYCSFVSSSIESKQRLIPEYLKALFYEMECVSRLVSEFSLNIKSIYVGGGTPGILTEEYLKALLVQINKLFISDTVVEFSFELGRPDTVTERKLELLKQYGVDRICINTQTTNNAILEAIHRKHTAEQYFSAVELAKRFDFSSINTDLIAGLNGESLESFKKSLSEVISTGVDNVTVHTLCVKKSSSLRETYGTSLDYGDIDSLIEYSQKYCISKGFEPYYLYRQKYALGNHESVGWCKHGKYSHYNIAMMNEIETVIGMGAGATSRVVSISDSEKHHHFENFKYPDDYIRDHHKMLKQIEGIGKVLLRLGEGY